jgi:uncharacterized protein involved in tellurium resistance
MKISQFVQKVLIRKYRQHALPITLPTQTHGTNFCFITVTQSKETNIKVLKARQYFVPINGNLMTIFFKAS